MTKSRFIKLIMGYGIQRKYAHWHAHAARSLGWSYQRYFDEILKPVFDAEWTEVEHAT